MSLPSSPERIKFTVEMKHTHTILVPMMLPIHFKLFQKVFASEGYKIEVLSNQSPRIIEAGLRYTHNDVCFPAQLTIGQLLDALLSGKYDTDKVALLLMQTGGGCRASNYISLLRKALIHAKLSHIPVLSFNLLGMEENPGFVINKQMIERLIVAVLLGDLIMNLYNQTLPYEIEKGASAALVDDIANDLTSRFLNTNKFRDSDVISEVKQILKRFDALSLFRVPKVKVGVVGEIYVKFAPLGNNNLERFLHEEGAEVVVPGLMDFVLYTIDSGIEDNRLYGTGFVKRVLSEILFRRIIRLQNKIIRAYQEWPNFVAPNPFLATKKLAKTVVHTGTKMGEGWLLTGEMLELIHAGVHNIVCTQPFGCLPNHIVGRGMIRKIKELHPEANIIAIDYDASATKVNQENRLKLMLTTAQKSLSTT